MAAKDVLSNAKGVGTKLAEYATGGPFSCSRCEYFKANGSKGLCNQKVVLKDPQVPTDKKSGLKIVSPTGCCRYVEIEK